MLDIKWIRERPEELDRALARRGASPRAANIQALDKARRDLQTRMQELQAERNRLSKEVGAAKAKKLDASDLMAKVSASKDETLRLEADEKAKAAELDSLLALLPNTPDASVPEGKDEHGNVEVRKVGAPKTYSFQPKDHTAIGTGLGLMDFDAAARISGARFVILKGPLARLERALGAFMLDLQTGEHGYSETAVPHLVLDQAAYGTGQLPKFAQDLFKVDNPLGEMRNEVEPWVRTAAGQKKLANLIQDFIQSRGVSSDWDELIAPAYEVAVREWLASTSPAQSLTGLFDGFLEFTQKLVLERLAQRRFSPERWWLIPTAEVPLTNLVREQIVEEAALPMRLTAQTPCYRSEAGAAGKDTTGMIRQHQFTKVELVSITRPEDSDKEHERMTGCAEEVLKRLELPYRTMLLCTGDMGFASRKTYDIEVWLPGQARYREISSCSNCGDFQARRMNARFKRGTDAKPEFVHTLNGSGLAVGRTLIAVLENYQNADGSVTVPAVLRPYMGGREKIARGN